MKKPDLILPIHCWDIYMMDFFNFTGQIDPNADLKLLQSFQQKHHWSADLDTILKKPYEALVLTDNAQTIQWVSDGFASMTGYPSDFAIGKKPAFLQGKNTSASSKRHIREHLFSRKKINAQVMNYRQNGEEYLCDLVIYPMIGEKNQISHFLALESEVS